MAEYDFLYNPDAEPGEPHSPRVDAEAVPSTYVPGDIVLDKPIGYEPRHRIEAAGVPVPDFPVKSFDEAFGNEVFPVVQEGLDGLLSTPWRPARRPPRVVTFVLAPALVISALVGSVMFTGLGDLIERHLTEEPASFTASFHPSDSDPVPIKDLTCRHLVSEVLAETTYVHGTPSLNPPTRVRDVEIHDEQLEAIGDLTKGDITREAIVCTGTAVWPGEARLPIVMRTSVHGGVADARTTVVKVLRSKKVKK